MATFRPALFVPVAALLAVVSLGGGACLGGGEEVAIDRESFSTPWSNDQLRWAADGKSFTFLHNRRGHQLLRLVSVDAASGAVRTVMEEQSPTFVDYAHKTWMHWLSETELLWMSERDGWNHLYLVDVAAGRISRRVTTGAWVVRAVESVDDDARTVTIRAMGIDAGQDPYHEHWLRIPIDGGDAVRLTRGDGTALSWPVAVGKPGQSWKGATHIVSKHVSPAWQAPASIRGGRGLGPVIPGGAPDNPMGARAMMLEKEEIAIHGTSPSMRGSIGSAASAGCIRMLNEHIIELYDMVNVGTPVIAVA
jgi:lipoprotein-anchoring transpeptidase ErfK/SrfK